MNIFNTFTCTLVLIIWIIFHITTFNYWFWYKKNTKQNKAKQTTNKTKQSKTKTNQTQQNLFIEIPQLYSLLYVTCYLLKIGPLPIISVLLFSFYVVRVCLWLPIRALRHPTAAPWPLVWVDMSHITRNHYHYHHYSLVNYLEVIVFFFLVELN